MKKLIASLKRMPLRQILTVFLAGIALLVNTACSQPKAQAYDDTMKGLPGRVEPEVSESARIKPTPRKQMNAYSDVDPRVRTTGAEEKAQELVENAERNVIDQTADVGTNTRRILDKKGENLDQSTYNRERDLNTTGDRARGTLNEAKGTAGKFGENLESVAGKTTGNAQDTVKGAQRSASATAERAQAKASEAASNTRQATRNTADQATSTVKGTTEHARARTAEAAEDTQEASGNILDRVTKSVKRAAEDASDFVENKTEQAAKGTQRAVEDTSAAAS